MPRPKGSKNKAKVLDGVDYAAQIAEKNTAAGGNEKINLFFIAIGGSRDCLQRSDYLKRNHGMKISELLHK